MGKYLPGIDGLRAFAVLAVVAYHAGLPVPAGYVGVDVFFVVSGFVITRMLQAEPQIDFVAFYARRVRRILPAMLVVVAATIAAAAVLLTADQQIATTRSAIAAMAMLANLHFQTVTGGYFDSTAEQMPLLHLWSLAVEEQFYLLWPLLLFLRRTWVIVALAVASFVFAQAYVSIDREVAFFQMPARFWELAVGGLLAMRPMFPRWGGASALVGVPVLCLAVMNDNPEFPGVGAVPAVLGTLLVLDAIQLGVRVPFLEWRPVRYIGRISYSLYLWHWPLLALQDAANYDAPTVPQRLAVCGIAFVLAVVSYHFVETPFRRGTAKPKVIAAGVLACVALAGCSGAFETVLRRSDSLSVRTALDAPREADCQGPDAACGADVVLWGDSHAKAWQPFAERYGTVHQLTYPGCIASTRDSQKKKCAAFNAKAARIAQRGETVILGGFWLERFDSGGGARESHEDFKSALALLRKVPRVIVIGPVPELPEMPQRCIKTGEFERCSVSRQAFDARAAGARAFMLAEIAKYPNVEYIEPADFFCSPTLCPMMRDGYSLYWDDDHISARAAAGFSQSLD